MRIGLIDCDHTGYPNLALMKISAYHKANKDEVEWYNAFELYDKVYASKVFNFTPDPLPYIIFPEGTEVVKGGTGYDIHSTLPEDIEYCTPDYSLYPRIDRRTAYGFLTRGCPNHCKWCVVPHKEGAVKPYMDIDQIAVQGRDRIILMDNNVLASEFGIQQIEKIATHSPRLYIDFNQGLDARLVTPRTASLLATCHWLQHIRFACDTDAQIEQCLAAMEMVNSGGGKHHFLLYTMIHGSIESNYKRLMFWRKYSNVRIHAQPFRTYGAEVNSIPQWQKDMARWANRRELYKSCDFMDYQPRNGFICKKYFE